MGEPTVRLNPQIESSIQKILLVKAVKLLRSIAFVLPCEEYKKRGVKPYDYRIILVLCILRIFLRKSYADYEIEMRTDMRICVLLGLKILPGKSTIQRGMNVFTTKLLMQFNKILIQDVIKRKLNILVDASGIRIIGKSIWYVLRIKNKILHRECDKIHIAVCADLLLILNWRITKWNKNDSPFFKILLAPFKILGIVIADLGYYSRKNMQYVVDKHGAAFIPFKKNAIGNSRGSSAWKFAFNLWKLFRSIFDSIYHQRSKIECVFSSLKRRYGDILFCRTAMMRRKEMALRFISYNLRIILYYQYAIDKNINLWVRARK